jgi:CheY-like chemotaxis protein
MANLLLVDEEPRNLVVPGIDLSEMDGHQTRREIRKQPQFRSFSRGWDLPSRAAGFRLAIARGNW